MGIIKQFIIRSKVLEITIGMIVAVAFERVISSMVAGILMPLIRTFTNEMMESYKTTVAGAKAPAISSSDAVAFAYGEFIEAVIVFLIIIYLIAKAVKTVEQLRKKEGLTPEDTPPSGSDPII